MGIRQIEMTRSRIRHSQSGHQTERDDKKQNKTRPGWTSDRERNDMKQNKTRPEWVSDRERDDMKQNKTRPEWYQTQREMT